MPVFTIYMIFCMLAVLWFDATRYLIPNWLVGSLLVLYPLAVYLSPEAVDWKMALAAALLVFVIGYIVFMRNWMGGGDIKLITVCALWVGSEHLLEFIFMVGILGGVFSVLVWALRKLLPHVKLPASMKLPRILRDGEPIPYGIAIAIGMLILISRNMLPLLSWA